MPLDLPYPDPQFEKDLEEWKRLQAEIEWRRGKTAGIEPAAEPPIQPYQEPLGKRLRRYGMRGLEMLGEFGRSAAQLPIEALKLPANIGEAAGEKIGPVPRKLRSAGRWLEQELHKGTRFFGEEAGTPLEEY